MNRPFPIQPAVPVANGMSLVRASIARAVAAKSNPVAYAEHRWNDDGKTARVVKGAVAAATSNDVNGDAGSAAVDYFSAVREQSGALQLPLRRRPVDNRYLINQGSMKGHWVAEGSAIPVLPLSLDQNFMRLLKVASIIVETDEALRAEDPRVEAALRQDMIAGLAQAIDEKFFDPANAGVAGEIPASISNGLTPTAIGSGSLDDVRESLTRLVEDFSGDLSRAHFVGSPELFAMFAANGFVDIGIRGGELLGAPAVATKGLSTSSGRYVLLLVDPGGIGYADAPERTQITVSQEAAVEMSDVPSGDSTTPTPSNLVALYQVNCVALRALAYANWEVEQDGAVAMALMFPEASVS